MKNIVSNPALQQFKNVVAIKFQLYNSLFTALPFHQIENTGILLSLFLVHCEESYQRGKSPNEIIESFLKQFTSYAEEKDQLDLLFRFVQYTERQVVLFDAVEDAAFTSVNDVNGAGTLKHLQSEVEKTQKENALLEKLNHFSVRLVLTAHPTQFYPDEVLGIIDDLAKALFRNNSEAVNTYLQQLGMTPFFQKKKPTPVDEANGLIWFLERVFYEAAGKIVSQIKSQFPNAIRAKNPLIRLGFWPGGDRDGNVFVTSDITLQVADALQNRIIRCYYQDAVRLRRRLTFRGVEEVILEIEQQLYEMLFNPEHKIILRKEELLEKLTLIRKALIENYNGLFLSGVDNLITKIQLFGFHFASLDIRQDSSVHHHTLLEIVKATNDLPNNYDKLSDDEKINLLCTINGPFDVQLLQDELSLETLRSMSVIKIIQQYNGEEGSDRYVISHTGSALHLMEVYGLLLLSGWKKDELKIDIVPLFESIDDLKAATAIMQSVYENETYRSHLTRRGNKQTIMLGFSDGTKDGGYLMANWHIYKAKEELTAISKKYDVDVVFFDGRGGPPARGGGKTNQFYASLGKNISNKEIQLTIQGQTISSNFGSVDAAQYNIEQLIHAGISNDLFAERKTTFTAEEEALINDLAEVSYECYTALKNHPLFFDYLNEVSPLSFYAETNIGSRPAKRGATSKLTLEDLRAIPFVGAWSQLKQNVTGYYGVGSALKELEEKGRWKDLLAFYQSSLFFKTLIDNCEMSMKKSFFPLTQFLADDPKYGELWKMIYNEYELTNKQILKLSNKNELLEDSPVVSLSIQMRERIVLPLVTIQQFALTKLRETKSESDELIPVYEKLIMRCSFGIINAGRNSA